MVLEVNDNLVISYLYNILVSQEPIEELLQCCLPLVDELCRLGSECLLWGEARQSIEGSEVELSLDLRLECSHSRVSVLEVE